MTLARPIQRLMRAVAVGARGLIGAGARQRRCSADRQSSTGLIFGTSPLAWTWGDPCVAAVNIVALLFLMMTMRSSRPQSPVVHPAGLDRPNSCRSMGHAVSVGRRPAAARW
jgi:hypothetical protein